MVRLYVMQEEQKGRHLEALASRAEEVRLIILEERLHITRSFYQLKRADQRCGFLSQPAFICVAIGPLLPSKKIVFTNKQLVDAVDLWCSTPEHRAVAEARYGHILAWDTSQVTDMDNLFKDKDTFNDDLSRWDTSNVTTMECMFNNASAFNGDINAWDTSNVTSMATMFGAAGAFNGAIHAWDTSNVTDMGGMFSEALVFNADIHAWDVSSVKNMEQMFWDAASFNGDISTWDVSNVTEMQEMFWGAKAFSGDIHEWNVVYVENMLDMFDDCPIPDIYKPPRALDDWVDDEEYIFS